MTPGSGATGEVQVIAEASGATVGGATVGGATVGGAAVGGDATGDGGWWPAVLAAVSVAGSGRLTFGSDLPLESHSAGNLGELVAMIDGLPIEPPDRGAIARGNGGRVAVAPHARQGHAAMIG